MQSNDDISFAINEGDLSDFAMDILTVSEDAADIFSKVDSKMEALKNCFECSEYDKLMNKYNSFRKSYSNVKASIVSYSDDLIALINKVKAGDKKVALAISDLTVENLRKAQNIEKL